MQRTNQTEARPEQCYTFEGGIREPEDLDYLGLEDLTRPKEIGEPPSTARPVSDSSVKDKVISG